MDRQKFLHRTKDSFHDGILCSLQTLTLRRERSKQYLWILGVNPEGESVAIKVNDFQPSMLIRFKESWTLYDDKNTPVDDFMEDLIEKVTIESDHKNQEKEEIISDYEIEERTPFIGFTNGRKDYMVRIHVTNPVYYKKVVHAIQDNGMHVYHEVYSKGDRYDLVNQFLIQKKISYQEWIYIPKRYYFEKSSKTKVSTCNREYIIEQRYLFKLPKRLEDYVPVIPPTLKCFVRLIGVSKDAAMGHKTKAKKYKPNAALPYDRIIGYLCGYSWAHNENPEPFLYQFHTLLPDVEYKMNNFHHIFYEDEKQMLKGIKNSLIQMDIDDLIYFPDYQTEMNYLFQRAFQLDIDFSGCDRFIRTNPMIMKEHAIVKSVKFKTRNLLNIVSTLKKKTSILIEIYDLYSCSCNKEIRRCPEQLKTLEQRYWIPNVWFGIGGKENFKKIIHYLVQDVNLIWKMEHDMGLRLEYANISKISLTSFSDTVLRGEQIRVFNKLSEFVVNDNKYINKEMLSRPPIKLSVTRYPPTKHTLPELKLNTNLREEKINELDQRSYTWSKRKKTYKQLTLDSNCAVENEESDEEMKAGGNVIEGSPGFWKNARICTLDFSALYPSIMMEFNISHENIIFDEEYLNIPGVKYIRVQIDDYHTVPIAQQSAAIPKLLDLLLNNRRAIKKKMKKTTDKFLKSVLDKAQLSIKVLCNATYGFCGASSSMGILPLRTIMFLVTSCGRDLQKEAAHYAGTKYKVPTVYGDSVTGLTPLLVRKNGNLILLETAESLWSTSKRALINFQGKEYLDLDCYETWSESGWTKITRIMRHKTRKHIYRVITPCGIVDVTEDHSLLSANGEKVSPKNMKIGFRLLNSFPDWNHEKATFCGLKENEAYHLGILAWKERKTSRRIDRWKMILSSTIQIRRAFLKGFSQKMNNNMFTSSSQVKCAYYYLLLHSLGNMANIHATENDFSIVPCQTATCHDGCVSEMIDLGIQYDYVYDLTTENHHFQAGIGQLIVHNTDSIFVWVKYPQTRDMNLLVQQAATYYSLDEMAEDNQTKKTMDAYMTKCFRNLQKNNCDQKEFNWANICQYYKESLNLDLLSEPYYHQVNAVIYLIARKLSKEITENYQMKYIDLEFEDMSDNVWLGGKKDKNKWKGAKKSYFKRFWNEDNPTVIDKIKKTGIAAKKRDWCLFTRKLLNKVIYFIAFNEEDKILPYVKHELQRLIDGKVPIEELRVSKVYEGEDKYKTDKLPQFRVVKKIESRQRCTLSAGTRIYQCFIKGKQGQKLYELSEEPEYIQEHGLQLDYVYYLEKQVRKPLEKQLMHHAHLFNFTKEFNVFVNKAKLKNEKQISLSDFFKNS